MPVGEAGATEGAVREGRHLVLGFLEAQGSWGPEGSARHALLGLLAGQLGRDIPEKAWTARNCRLNSETSQLQTRRRGRGGNRVWAAWLRRPVDGDTDQCVLTEILVRVTDSQVVCVGLRLLLEVADEPEKYQLRRLQERVAFSGAIQSLCQIYAELTGKPKPPPALQTDEDTDAVARHLLDPHRTKPVIVISTRKDSEAPSAVNFGSGRLARDTHGLADVYVLVSRQTFVLKDRVGPRNSVFDGAVRIFMPGLERDSEPWRHRYWTVAKDASKQDRQRTEMEIQAYAAASSTNAYRLDGGTLPYDWARRLKWRWRMLTALMVLGRLPYDRARRLKRRPIRQRSDEAPAPLQDPDRSEQASPEVEPTLSGEIAEVAGPPLDAPKGWLGRLASKSRDTVELWRDPTWAPARVQRVALAETERRLRQSEEKRISIQKEATHYMELADLYEDDNNKLKKRLAAEIERRKQLEAQLKRLRPLPEDWSQFLSWYERNLGGSLILHPNATKEIQRAMHENYENVGEAAKGLRWLAWEYRDSRLHGAGKDLRGQVEGVNGLHNEPCGHDAYQINWNGSKQLVDWHLKHGTSIDRRHCLRIYYFWDDELGQAVVAHMPSHRGSPG